MPDTLTSIPAPAAVSAAAPEPQQQVWTTLRQLLGAEPSEDVLRMRAMLSHLHAAPGERMRALHGLMSAAPVTYRTLAMECGWQPELEPCIGWDLAITALVMGDADEEGR